MNGDQYSLYKTSLSESALYAVHLFGIYVNCFFHRDSNIFIWCNQYFHGNSGTVRFNVADDGKGLSIDYACTVKFLLVLAAATRDRRTRSISRCCVTHERQTVHRAFAMRGYWIVIRLLKYVRTFFFFLSLCRGFLQSTFLTGQLNDCAN